MNKDEALRAYPDFPWLRLDDSKGIARFLAERDWLEPGEEVTGTAKAGEGNMNLTVRVTTDRRTLILKQARPWVEKYDTIPAPWQRATFERRFYERIARIPDVASRMPKLLAADDEARALLLEDLPGARDLTPLYAGGRIEPAEIDDLGAYLRALHDATLGHAEPELENREMRELNHEHLFVVPLDENNGVPLDRFEPGLSEAASQLRRDERFAALLAETGRRYLAVGRCLVHGDYFPGSWLRTRAGVRIIDPEFCYYGDPEFDLGCAIAHLALASQLEEAPRRFLDEYRRGLVAVEIDEHWIARYAATEIVRRLIGVAQLPIPASSNRRAELLEQARRMMLEPTWDTLWK